MLLIVSCTDEKEEALSDTSAPETEMEEAPEVLPETEEEKEVVVEEAEEQTEVIEPTENEIELYNQLAGGFFYTSNILDDYSLNRKESIVLFNNQVIDVLEKCYDLYDGGIKAYEDKLLLFIGNIEASRTQYDESFQYIIEEMMANKTIIETLMNRGNGYFEIIENSDTEAVTKASINYEIFENTVVLYETLDEYLLFLDTTSEFLAAGIIEDFNGMYADILRQHTSEVFEDQVLSDLVEVVKSYDRMSLMYTLINSSDFFYRKSKASEINAQLDGLGNSENILKVKEAFNEAINNPSEYIIVVVESTDDSTFKWPFVKRVYAESTGSEAYKNAIAIQSFINRLSADPNITEDDITESLMGMVLQEHNVQIEEKKKEIKEKKEKTPEVLSPESMLVLGGEKILEMAGAEKIWTLAGTDGNIGPYPYNGPTSEEEKDIVPIDSQKINASVKEEIINQEKRDKMIEKLRNLQASDEAAGANFLMMFTGDLGGEFVYNRVIKSFANVLEDNKNKMKGETFDSLNQILTNDLEEILGSKKTAFANKFLETSAEDIVNNFADWVNNSENRKNIKIDRNTLIAALDAMGFEHEGNIEEAIEEMASEETEGSLSDNGSDELVNLEGKEEVLLDYLSYMLPYIGNIDEESLEAGATKLNISKEEMYIYAMTVLVSKTVDIVDGKEKTSADEERLVNGLESFLNGQGSLDPWVKNYAINMFYDLFNEKGDLDRWQGLSEAEKLALIEEGLNAQEEQDPEEEKPDENEVELTEENEDSAIEADDESMNQDSQHDFVFYRNNTNIVSAEHTLTPYNDDYMRRDTISYYEDGTVASKASILLTVEASENMILDYTQVMERQKNAEPGDFVPKPLAPARQNYFKIGLHESYNENGSKRSLIEYDDSGNVISSKQWKYYEDGSLKEYIEMDGNQTGTKTHYASKEYGGGKKYTDVYEENKAVNRINYE